MAWYRCIGDNSTGLSTLVVKPYNVVNGNYSTNNNVITYNIIPTGGYEGMSVQLVNLEIDTEYLITFDVLLTGLNNSFNSYSWKVGIKDGTLIQYTGDYSKPNLYNGELDLPETNNEKKSFSFYVKPQSSTTTLYFCTAAAPNDLTLIINNFKYVNRDVEKTPVPVDISDFVYISETEFNNLQDKDSNTIYAVYYDANSSIALNWYYGLVWKKYQGDKRIVAKENYEEYWFWYEGCNLSYDSYSYERYINPNITFTDFKDRNWQLEFHIRNVYENKEQAIIGNTYGGAVELYLNSSNQLNIYGSIKSSSTPVEDVIGHDMKLIHTKNQTVHQIEVYKDDTLVETWTCADPTSSDDIQLFNYRSQYPISAFFEYIGFKWLD